jgi:hypothetical protein
MIPTKEIGDFPHCLSYPVELSGNQEGNLELEATLVLIAPNRMKR